MSESTLNEEDSCVDISDTKNQTEIKDYIMMSSFNKYMNITEEIPVTVEVTATSESIGIIKPMIDKLFEVIGFLKEEIREKNLLIKTLNFRNANDGELINTELINSKTFESNIETTLDSSLNSYKELCEVKLGDSQNIDYVKE